MKKMQKLFGLLLVLCMVLSFAPVTALAAESGSCGENVTWTFEDGVLTISGEGAMEDYEGVAAGRDQEPSYRALGNTIEKLVVEDGVTYLGKNAFWGLSGLKEVRISDTVTSMGFRVFCSSGVTHVTLPANLTELPAGAFSKCTALKTVTFPEGLAAIGEEAFADCTSLQEVTFPESLRKIDTWAFRCCVGLTHVEIPATLTEMGGAIFQECSGIASAVFAEGITAIPNEIFGGCENLTDVTIPEGVTTIQPWAFHACASLEYVELPSTLTTIGDNAFAMCSSFEYVELPEGVVTLGSNAFAECENLVLIYLPDSLTEMGEGVFKDCKSLAAAILPEGLKALPAQTFSDCTSLVDVILPQSLETIGKGAFYDCTSLEMVILPRNLQSLDTAAFMDCESLVLITLPVSVTHIHDRVFYGCTSLTEVLYEGGQEEWEDMSIGLDNEGLYYAAIYGDCEIPVRPPFFDVELAEWYTEPVIWAVEHGITNGMTPFTFEPETVCTREQVVTFLWRAAGCPEPTITECPFTDVKLGRWYTDPILWAVEKGITNGMTETEFGFGEPCDRAAVVTFLWRANGSPKAQSSRNPFKDVKTSSWYGEAVLWAVENGITDGMSPTTFEPETECTRAHIVTFLYRDFA